MTCCDSGCEPPGTSAHSNIKQESGRLPPDPCAVTSPSPACCRNRLSMPRARRVTRPGLDGLGSPLPSWRQYRSLCRQSAKHTAVPQAAPSQGRDPPRMEPWGLRQHRSRDLSPEMSHLHATAACTEQALFTMGSSAAMYFELFSPNLLQGPVQALTMRSPAP